MNKSSVAHALAIAVAERHHCNDRDTISKFAFWLDENIFFDHVIGPAIDSAEQYIEQRKDSL